MLKLTTVACIALHDQTLSQTALHNIAKALIDKRKEILSNKGLIISIYM